MDIKELFEWINANSHADEDGDLDINVSILKKKLKELTNILEVK